MVESPAQSGRLKTLIHLGPVFRVHVTSTSLVTIDTFLASARGGVDQPSSGGNRRQTMYFGDGYLNGTRGIIFSGSHRVGEGHGITPFSGGPLYAD